MQQTIVRKLIRAGLLAATALAAAACVVEPAYGPAYSSPAYPGYDYAPPTVYVGPTFEYHDRGHWHHDRDDRGGDRHHWR